MCSTCNNALHMPKMIQIRDVPDDVHRTLKSRAAAAGMSLSDYIKRDLERSARRMSMEEIDARVMARGPSGIKTEDTVRLIRELRGD
jgi:antitoxin FitA